MVRKTSDIHITQDISLWSWKMGINLLDHMVSHPSTTYFNNLSNWIEKSDITIVTTH